MPSHGEIVWTELNTWKQAEAMAFYAATLGWEYDEMPVPGGGPDEKYVIARKGSTMICGINQLKSPDADGAPESWLTYFEVDDVDATMAAMTKAGAEVLFGPIDIPTVGRIASVQAPGGAFFALMTSVEQPAEAG